MLGFRLRSAIGLIISEVPVGGVIMLTGATIPSGWALYSAADGRALFGASTVDEASADLGPAGDGELVLSGSTVSAGEHSGTTFIGAGSSLEPGDRLKVFAAAGNFGGHTHSFSATRPYNPGMLNHQLIQKTGTGGEIPPGGSVFTAGTLSASGFSAVTDYIGRVLRGSNSSTPSTVAAVSATGVASYATSVSGAHVHGTPEYVGFGFFNRIGVLVEEAGAHAHNFDADVTSISLPVGRVAQYRASAQAKVPVGSIVAFDGDTANIANGWRLCDGSNGTMDLRGRFLEIAVGAAAGVVAGDGTVVWDGALDPAGAHRHDTGGTFSNIYNYSSASHSNTEPDHTHAWDSRSGSINLRRRTVRFIQFIP